MLDNAAALLPFVGVGTIGGVLGWWINRHLSGGLPIRGVVFGISLVFAAVIVLLVIEILIAVFYG